MAKQTLSNDTRDRVELDRNSGVNACAFSCSFIVLSVCVLIIAIFINGFLPEPLNSRDVTDSSEKYNTYNFYLLNFSLHYFMLLPFFRFIASRAFQDLQVLSDFGPKVVGTYENDVLAARFIEDEILKVVASTPAGKNKISYDIQKPSGCFSYTFVRSLCYDDITNIIVKVEPVSPVKETILLNCHFDSVPTSPGKLYLSFSPLIIVSRFNQSHFPSGTSDDGLNCAVLLEILRMLARSREPLKKNVLFLFNGAEEAGLLVSEVIKYHSFETRNWHILF